MLLFVVLITIMAILELLLLIVLFFCFLWTLVVTTVLLDMPNSVASYINCQLSILFAVILLAGCSLKETIEILLMTSV